MRCSRPVVLAVVALFGWMSAAMCAIPASAPYVPKEVPLDEAEAVVAGKVTQVDAKAGTATVAISEYLKGGSKVKTVTIRYLSAFPMKRTTGYAPTEGQTGAWILLRYMLDDDGSYYVGRPDLFCAEAELPAVKKILAELEKKPWSKPENALAASALVYDDGKSDYRRVYFAVKNMGDKPISVCEFWGNMPLWITLTAPDGKKRELLEYNEQSRISPIMERDFTRLQPGETRYICQPYGAITGSVADKPGKWTVAATYHNKDDGKAFKVGTVWTGEVAAPIVTFEVAPPAAAN